MPNAPHDTASDVTAEQGEVHIDGPGGTALSLTPKAAAETAARLQVGALDAHQQRREPEGSK